MAETKANCPTSSTNFKEAVCISADRIYDSCCDRDCLEDLKCYFSSASQQLVSEAECAHLRSAEVVYTNIDVEPVNFHRGYYNCCLTFYFLITADLSGAGIAPCTTVTGLTCAKKQVILYGSEGSVKTFTGTFNADPCGTTSTVLSGNAPRCTVQVVDPVALSARVCTSQNGCSCNCNCCTFPTEVLSLVGGSVVTPESGAPALYCTLGLFSVVQLMRPSQLLVPVYDFAFPEKKCIDNTDSPCDVFRSIDFPTDDFFPPRPCNLQSGCGCDDSESN